MRQKLLYVPVCLCTKKSRWMTIVKYIEEKVQMIILRQTQRGIIECFTAVCLIRNITMYLLLCTTQNKWLHELLDRPHIKKWLSRSLFFLPKCSKDNMLVNKLSKLIGRRTNAYIILLFKKISQCFTQKNLETIILHSRTISIS